MPQPTPANRRKSDLVRAVKNGDLDLLTDIIKHSPVSEREDLLAQGLCVACEQKHLALVQHVVSLGADPNRKFGNRAPPLLIAVALDQAEILKHLLENERPPSQGVPVDERAKSKARNDALKRSALTAAKSRAVAELLVQHGADIHAVGKEGKTLLMDLRCPPVVELVVEAGAALEAKDDEGRTALMTTIMVDKSPEISKILIEKGADINARDKKRRTILINAVWLSRLEVIEMLLQRRTPKVNVNAVDDSGRNALHHLAGDKKRAYEYRPNHGSGLKMAQQERDQRIVEMLLKAGLNATAEDALGRTCLHWAAATGCSGLAKVLLDTGKLSVNAVEHRSKTALHLAATASNSMTVQVLLDMHASVHAEADGDWTPLHNACWSSVDSVDVVERLLRAKAELHGRTRSGRTPLHIAARAGNLKIARNLLKRKDIKRSTTDVFGNTPLFYAASISHPSRDEMVRLFAPWNNLHTLSDDAVRAAKLFEATIVDFGESLESEGFNWTGTLTQRRSVFDLLYGTDPKDGTKSAVSSLTPGTDPNDFRWIHLPSNNISWCLDLITKHFIEDGAKDVSSFKALERSFNHQHRGSEPHSRYMTPLCQNVMQSSGSADSVWNAEEETEGGISRKSTFNVKDHLRPPQQGRPASPQSASTNESKRGSLRILSDVASSKDKAAEKKTRKPLHARPQLEGLLKDNLISDFYMFMPYLHFETYPQRQEMFETYSKPYPSRFTRREHRARTISEPKHNQRLASASHDLPSVVKDEALFRAYLNTSEVNLHIRRTLDQFFYHNIDTQERDSDQVVHRYQDVVEKSDPSRHKILMVDQLWMWVLGKKTVITSFPQRWRQPKKDPLNVLESILTDINSGSRERVRSVYELAMIISGRCYGAYDRHDVGSDDSQFLDMFEGWIGAVMDDEVKLFERFKQDSANASEWLGNPHSLRNIKRKQKQKYRSGIQQRPDFTAIKRPDEKNTDDHGFVENLLDIGWETALLGEIKDIRDELDMLSLVFELQEQVLPSMKDAMRGIWEQDKWQPADQQRIQKAFEENARLISGPQKDIQRMERQAKRMYNSIRDLLDLKQKHANAIEARYAREQTDDTSRQGHTLMVFTVVTVIFLPLSFIAAFFAIDIGELPHVGNVQQMSLSFASKYIFGIGLSVAVVCVIIALFVEDVAYYTKELGRRFRKRKRRRSSEVNNQSRAVGDEFELSKMHHRQAETNAVLRAVRARASRSQDLERDATAYAIAKGDCGFGRASTRS